MEIIEAEECFSLKDLDVNGTDLILAGFPKGRIIGDILSYLLKSVMEEKTENKKEALLAIAKEQFGE